MDGIDEMNGKLFSETGKKRNRGRSFWNCKWWRVELTRFYEHVLI